MLPVVSSHLYQPDAYQRLGQGQHKILLEIHHMPELEGLERIHVACKLRYPRPRPQRKLKAKISRILRDPGNRKPTLAKLKLKIWRQLFLPEEAAYKI